MYVCNICIYIKHIVLEKSLGKVKTVTAEVYKKSTKFGNRKMIYLTLKWSKPQRFYEKNCLKELLQ